jgi:hypothetical protein
MPVCDLLAEASREKSNEILLSEIRLGVAANVSLQEKQCLTENSGL